MVLMDVQLCNRANIHPLKGYDRVSGGPWTYVCLVLTLVLGTTCVW
jgi:hypothetical protein